MFSYGSDDVPNRLVLTADKPEKKLMKNNP
jgi:hypothetical protein